MKRGGETFEQKRRAWLKQALVGGAALPLLLREALAASGRGEGMAELKGEVRINGRRASPGAALSPGDTVTTAPGASAVFVVGRDAFLMRESTELRTAGGEALAGALRLVTGKLLSVFGRGPRSIVTGTATMGIRGTGIYLEAEAERTYVCTCYGTVEMQANNMPEARETVQTKHHEAPRYIYARGEMPIKMIVAAPLINHTDAELIMLEALVGRVPPFVASGEKYPSF